MNVKLLSLGKLVERLNVLRKQGKRVVFTNGCFDLLHVGHVRYLNEAKASGDILVVGLNSDRSVNTIKGIKRPIVTQNQRAEVLSGLACVDFVTIFDAPDPFELIKTLRPDVLVKGADWKEDEIIGADIVKESGGRVLRVTLAPSISTTIIIDRIIERHRQSE